MTVRQRLIEGFTLRNIDVAIAYLDVIRQTGPKPTPSTFQVCLRLKKTPELSYKHHSFALFGG